MQNGKSTCCNDSIIVDECRFVCIGCGAIGTKALDTAIIQYGTHSTPMRNNYSRKGRFVRKILGSLLRLSSCPKLHGTLIQEIAKAQQPEDTLRIIASWIPPKGSRRPYILATHYWAAANKELPSFDQNEINVLISLFDDVFFAWRRLDFDGPMFPYTTLLRKLISRGRLNGEPFSESFHYIVKFTRPMRCKKRKLRYSTLFEKCFRYIKQNANRSASYMLQ